METLVCHFVDPDLGVEIFFEKEGSINITRTDYVIGG